MKTLYMADYWSLEWEPISFMGLQELTLSHGEDTSVNLTHLRG